MNLLADLYSTIDSKKRQLKGLLSDPVETIYQGIRNIGQDWNGLLDTQAQAYPFIPRTKDQQARIQAMARTQEQAKKELADQGANMGIAAATVWHGSPHKFDKFDSSKIGTGEGAQAYGHGLYLAESPNIADWYRRNLTPGQYDVKTLGIDGQKFKRLDFPTASHVKDGIIKSPFTKKQQAILDNLSKDELSVLGDIFYSGDVNKLRARYSGETSNSYGMVAGDEKRLGILEKLIPRLTQDKKGNLYKVDLPDEAIAKMLDWDKPLSQQAPEVQKALGDYIKAAPEWTGGQYYNDVVSHLGGQRTANQGGVGGAVSERLMQKGIPGIRYLDGGSRGAGQGTSNYVVFPGNENLLTILERNGQPVGLLD